MAEHDEEPAQHRHKIDLTVAGHTVIVDSDADLEVVEATAKRLFEWTSNFARRSTVGYSVPAPETERLPEDLS